MIGGVRRGVNITPETSFRILKSAPLRSQKNLLPYLRKGDWKLIETFDPESVELYHLGRDLSESTNIAARETAKLLELRQDLAEWRQ